MESRDKDIGDIGHEPTVAVDDVDQVAAHFCARDQPESSPKPIPTKIPIASNSTTPMYSDREEAKRAGPVAMRSRRPAETGEGYDEVF